MSGDERSEEEGEEEEEEEEETNDEEDVEQRNDLELVRENAVDSQRLQGKPIGDKAHIDPTAFLKGSSVGGSGPGGGKRGQQFADISSAFAGEDVVGEFEEEKEQVVEESKPKDVDLTLPGMRIRACMHLMMCNVQYAPKIACPKSRVLLRRFAASVVRIHCAHVQTTHVLLKIMAKGRNATQTTTQRFSRPVPLLLLYHAPSFGCSSFFVHRGLCKNRSIDMRGRTQCYT